MDVEETIREPAKLRVLEVSEKGLPALVTLLGWITINRPEVILSAYHATQR